MGWTNMQADPIDAACRLHEAAVAHRGAGRLARAQAACRRSLALLEEVVGPDHPDVANVLNTLVLVLHELERYDEAEALARRSVGIMEAILNNLALFVKSQGRHDEAEPLYRRALAIFECALGPGHPRTLACRANLDSLLQGVG
jgi:tetratricopeptide (TPR) repeat protein